MPVSGTMPSSVRIISNFSSFKLSGDMVHRGEDSSILGEGTTGHNKTFAEKKSLPVGQDHGPVHLKKVLCSIQIRAESYGEKVIWNLLPLISSDTKSYYF